MNGGRFESWLRCPCCVRRAEHMVTTMHRRVTSALAAGALAALAALCLSGGPVQAEPAASRIALIAIAATAVAAFAVLQVWARSRHRRTPVFADWRAWPPGYDPETGTCAEPAREARPGV
jgi:hypothetical protein